MLILGQHVEQEVQVILDLAQALAQAGRIDRMLEHLSNMDDGAGNLLELALCFSSQERARRGEWSHGCQHSHCKLRFVRVKDV